MTRHRHGHSYEPVDRGLANVECNKLFGPVEVRKKKRFGLQACVWFGLLVAGGLLSFILIYQIMAVVAIPKPTDTSTPEFRLYKNTRFRTCLERPPSASQQPPVNCTLLEANLNTDYRPDMSWIGTPPGDRQYFMSGPEYQISDGARDPKPSWCDLASCMAGWKVVPSAPRESAFGLTPLKAWSNLLVTAFTFFRTVRGLLSGPDKRCQRAEFVDWLFLAWSVGQLGFWWWAFVTFARDPAMAQPVSVEGWASTWNLASSVGFHPWSCYFERDSVKRRGLSVALYAAAFAQWAATVHALRQQDVRDALQKYDCLASGIAAAPGSSSCTAVQLCSKAWLFTNPDFQSQDDRTALMFYKIAVWYAVALFPAFLCSTTVFAVLRYWYPRKWEWVCDKVVESKAGDGREYTQWLRYALFMLQRYFGLVYAVPFFTGTPPKFDFKETDPAGLATVAYDFRCRAVHVGISPTYSYLDINAYARSLRIVRQWFNA
ncbi:hypothetical protein PG993_008265 [Apiospora rasikravindrae]|uniref:Uncharacterized protein n=1 Tax=Apiospora rasikravindrae TaxID=990691 RepID=A0ABR1SZV9_9PEZI